MLNGRDVPLSGNSEFLDSKRGGGHQLCKACSAAGETIVINLSPIVGYTLSEH